MTGQTISDILKSGEEDILQLQAQAAALQARVEGLMASLPDPVRVDGFGWVVRLVLAAARKAAIRR